MKNIDIIVVGATPGSLISSLILQDKGYNVQIIDEHNTISGRTPIVRKGRFTFLPNYHHLYFDDKENTEYSLQNILKELDVPSRIKFMKLNDAYTITLKNEKYTFPLGIDDYIKRVEKYVEGSTESLKNFFELALECKEVLKYLSNTKEIDFNMLKEKYHNFMRIAPYSVSKVLDAIDMPLKAQELLNACYFYFGSSETEISFIQYATFMYDYINSGVYIPIGEDYSIAYSLYDKFLEKGGKIKFNSRINKLLVEDDQVDGVCLEDKTTLYADYVIVSGSQTACYGKLIDPSRVPRKAYQLLNQREPGHETFTVLLGLNRTADELGIKNCLNFNYEVLDTDVLLNKSKELLQTNHLAICLNKIKDEISPLGTCTLQLSTIYSPNVFGAYLAETSGEDLKKEIANNLIDSYEKNNNIKIREYIEEIEIISPLEYAKDNLLSSGSTVDFHIIGNDNLLPRLLNKDNEQYVQNLHIIDGFNGDIFGYDSTLIKGVKVAEKIINSIEGE